MKGRWKHGYNTHYAAERVEKEIVSIVLNERRSFYDTSESNFRSILKDFFFSTSLMYDISRSAWPTRNKIFKLTVEIVDESFIFPNLYYPVCVCKILSNKFKNTF